MYLSVSYYFTVTITATTTTKTFKSTKNNQLKVNKWNWSGFSFVHTFHLHLMIFLYVFSYCCHRLFSFFGFIHFSVSIYQVNNLSDDIVILTSFFLFSWNFFLLLRYQYNLCVDHLH